MSKAPHDRAREAARCAIARLLLHLQTVSRAHLLGVVAQCHEVLRIYAHKGQLCELLCLEARIESAANTVLPPQLPIDRITADRDCMASDRPQQCAPYASLAR